MDKRKLRDHNANQVSKFLEFRDPTIHKNTAGSNLNLESDRKSESRVPLSERGHKSLDCDENGHFRRHVLPILFRIVNKDIFKPALLLEHDPTALRRWRAGETGNDKKQMEKFDRLCKFVATQLDMAWPGIRVVFVVNPDDEEANSPREANDRKRTWDKEASYRLIDREITQIIQDENCTVEGAIGLYRDRLERAKKPDVSPRKIFEARRFVRNEQDGAA